MPKWSTDDKTHRSEPIELPTKPKPKDQGHKRVHHMTTASHRALHQPHVAAPQPIPYHIQRHNTTLPYSIPHPLRCHVSCTPSATTPHTIFCATPHDMPHTMPLNHILTRNETKRNERRAQNQAVPNLIWNCSGVWEYDVLVVWVPAAMQWPTWLFHGHMPVWPVGRNVVVAMCHVHAHRLRTSPTRPRVGPSAAETGNRCDLKGPAGAEAGLPPTLPWVAELRASQRVPVGLMTQ